MKRSGVLAALCLLLVAVFTVGAGNWSDPHHLKGGTGSTDSLTANPETLSTFRLPSKFDSAFVSFVADSQTVCRIQVDAGLAAGTAEWFTIFGADSNKSVAVANANEAQVKHMPAIYPKGFAGRNVRVILDNKHSGTVYGRAFLTIVK